MKKLTKIIATSLIGASLGLTCLASFAANITVDPASVFPTQHFGLLYDGTITYMNIKNKSLSTVWASMLKSDGSVSLGKCVKGDACIADDKKSDYDWNAYQDCNNMDNAHKYTITFSSNTIACKVSTAQ